jgi:tRNA dimethylallyltransferase
MRTSPANPIGPATAVARAAFIVGPTGAGKSALAIDLASALDAEIVNADSRLFYKGLDIGTAKPASAERTRVRHHLIDIREPDEPLDIASFLTMARAVFADISGRGRRILVVGGSGLYLRVLRRGLCAAPPASRDYRDHLRALADRGGIASLHDQLAIVDPAGAARIGRGDFVRIARALEVFHLTGVTLSEYQARDSDARDTRDADLTSSARQLVIGLAVDRARLYETLDRRFDAMVAAGLVDEVRGLLARGYRPDRAPLATIGYRQIADYLEGRRTLGDAIAIAQRETRRLAKRQLTWFRAEDDILWLDSAAAPAAALAMLEEFFSAPISAKSEVGGPDRQGRNGNHGISPT